MNGHEPWIVAAVRTPMGRYAGALAGVRPDDLAALAIRGLLERAGVPPGDVEDVIVGCANQAGEDNRNVARMALLLAGLPVEVPGVTVNRLCGSGLEAVVTAARTIAGGVESMSRAPWALAKPQRGLPRGDQVLQDTALGWRFVNPRMADLYGSVAERP